MTPDVQRWFGGTDWTEHTRPVPESALHVAPPAPGLPGGAGTAWLPGEPIAEPAAEPVAGWPTAADPAAAGAGWAQGGTVGRYGTAGPAYGTVAPSPGGTGYGTAGYGTAGFGTAGYGTAGYGTAGYGTAAALGSPRVGAVPALAGGWTTGVGTGAWQPAAAPAHWGWRVLATLLDELVIAFPYVGAAVYAGLNSELVVDVSGQLVTQPTAAAAGAMGLGALLMLVLWFVNRVVVQGRTGQSWGKRVVGLRTVHEDTSEPLGMWWALVRDVAHVVNGVLLCLGYLWPLWDPRRQAFSDKLTHALVLRDPR